MHHGNKADLLKCLEPLIQHPNSSPEVDVKILDGTALVHTLELKNTASAVLSFKDYADKVLLPYIFKQLHIVQQIYVVWDSYSACRELHIRESTVVLELFACI